MKNDETKTAGEAIAKFREELLDVFEASPLGRAARWLNDWLTVSDLSDRVERLEERARQLEKSVTQLENVVDELIQLVGTVSAASHDRDDWLTSRIEVLSEQAGFAARRQHLLDQRVYRDPEIITPVDGEGAA